MARGVVFRFMLKARWGKGVEAQKWQVLGRQGHVWSAESGLSLCKRLLERWGSRVSSQDRDNLDVDMGSPLHCHQLASRHLLH